MKATGTIPIVMVGAQGYDPVALGLIESFRRPGGNVTGMYGQWSEMEAKRPELVKELLPGTSLVRSVLGGRVRPQRAVSCSACPAPGHAA